MARPLALPLAILAVVALVAGCSDQEGNVYLHITNATGTPIEIVLLNPATGSEYVMEREINAGKTSTTRSDVYPGEDCSDRGILVARDTQGIEVGRRTGRICKGDAWVIASSGTPS
jgi:hypothetical protein